MRLRRTVQGLLLIGMFLLSGWGAPLRADPPRALLPQPRQAERDSFVDRNRNGVNDLLEKRGRDFLKLVKRKLETKKKRSRARPPR